MHRSRCARLLAALVCFIAAASDGIADCTGVTFRAPVTYASPANQIVLVSDLDGDGAPEIITSGNHVEQLDAFSVLQNRGDGTFAAERLIPTEHGERLESAGDLDGDRLPDLLASNYWNNGIVTHRNRGMLQFDAGVDYATATHGGPSLLADYDGDAVPDVLSLSFGSGNPVRLHRFRGLGNGSLAPKSTFDTSLAVGAVPSLRVINGTIEILVSEHSGNLGLLRLTESAVAVSRLPAGPGFDLSAVFADVNGDGIADIVDTNDGQSEAATSPFEWIFVTLGKPDGSFLERRQLRVPRKGAFPVKVRDGDFDGDSRRDLVVGDFRAAAVIYFRGLGDGTFEEGLPVSAGGSVNDFALADVNHDGRLDIVTVNNERSVSVIINAGPCPPARRRAARH